MLVLTESVDIVRKSDDAVREMFGECGRPVRLTFVRENPRYAAGAEEPPPPATIEAAEAAFKAAHEAAAEAEAEAEEEEAAAKPRSGGAGEALENAPPPPARGQGRGAVEPAWKTKQKQEAGGGAGKPAAAGAAGAGDALEGFTYNWKTGLHHNATTGYSYDQQVC